MAFDGSGTYVRNYNWAQDAANAIPITASRFDTEHNGFAAGLTNCITRDGQGKPSADINWQSHGITSLRDPTAPQEPVTLAFLNGTSGLNYLQGTQIKYIQTAAEIAASVTPISNQYNEGHVFRYFSSAQIADVLSGALAQDVTTALNTCMTLCKAGIAIYQPAGTYLISDSITATNGKSMYWCGVPSRTVIVNKAAASKPTFKFVDCQEFLFERLVISGRASFPNEGILLTTSGGQTCAFFELRDIIIESNGIGIELVKLNTGQINNCKYWPSGGVGAGSTRDAGTAKHGVFNDSSIANNYCNGVSYSHCNLVGVDTTIAGHACIKLGGANGVQNNTVFDCEMEGIDVTALDITGAYGFKALCNFVENADINLTNCRYSSVESCYNSDDIVFTGCINTFLINHVQGPATTSFTIDVTSTNCGAINAEFQNAPADGGVNSVFMNWSVAGTKKVDIFGSLGIRERNRGFAMGEWTTPTFAAGDYTSNAGTWVLQSGDVATFEYTVVGKTMTVNFWLDTTTTTGAPATLQILIPGGFTANKNVRSPFIYTEDNEATTKSGVLRISAGDTKIQLRKDYAGTAWANVTNLIGCHGSVTFEVQ